MTCRQCVQAGLADDFERLPGHVFCLVTGSLVLAAQPCVYHVADLEALRQQAIARVKLLAAMLGARGVAIADPFAVDPSHGSCSDPAP